MMIQNFPARTRCFDFAQENAAPQAGLRHERWSMPTTDSYEGPRRCHPRAQEQQAPACAAAPNAEREQAAGALGFILGLLAGLFGGRQAESCAGPAAAPVAPRDSYPLVPEVDGSAAGWKNASSVLATRLSGSESAKSSLHLNGDNPWTNTDGKMEERAAVYWALQKNPNVKYDADRKVFVSTRGGQEDQVVATLDDVVGTIRQNGGANPSNGAAYNAVGELLRARLS